VDKKKKLNYLYVIIFKGSKEDVQPLLYADNISELREIHSGHMHIFDEVLAPILQALEYCLHLPRFELDVADAEVEQMDIMHDEPQDILLVPDEVYAAFSFPSTPTLIIYADGICQSAMEKIKKEDLLINPLLISMLSRKTLINNWIQLSEQREWAKGDCVPNVGIQFLLDEEKMAFLPALFTARQFGRVEEVYNKIFNTKNIFEECAEILYNQWANHVALMKLSSIPDFQEEYFEAMYKKEYKSAFLNGMINVVVTMPGIPRQQIKRMNLSPQLPTIEKRVIRIMALHRAIAKKALIIELPIASEKLFQEYNELEINCASERGTNNKYVHRSLRNIGRILEKSIPKQQLWAISRAKTITVFSDFPLGVAIFENTDSSIQCYKEISYRPLTPLTRSLQIEMSKRGQVYLGARCKVAFAECIINDEANCFIKKCSKSITKILKEFSRNSETFEFVYKETLTIEELKKFIRDNSDADILHISAHGFCNREQNMAGLMVGNEEWMADDIDVKVSPIVILSACHVSPRGNGTVNVADLFMRAGAKTVLGTFVPIYAHRNSLLIVRLYTYIMEAQKGSDQYKTLSEAWQGVVATNAINEIIASSDGLEEWFMGLNSKGKRRLIDFELERSVGKLHGPNIYSETICIIKEMLSEEGVDRRFASVLEQKDFFPESFFYQWIGFPENVFLYNEMFKNAIQKHQI
jgi:hypothetical protein